MHDLFVFILENTVVVVHTNTLDSGSYKCEAYNAYSSDEKTVDITIEGLYSYIRVGIIFIKE